MINRFLFSVLLSLAFIVAVATSVTDANPIIIRDVTVIDGTGKPARPHMTVTIRDGRIESVESLTHEGKTPKGSRVIDGSSKFLIPGLWDAHLHLTDVGEEAIPLLVTYGITSVRDMGGDVPKLMSWRTQIEKGELVGPRIKLCGPMLEGKWDPASVGGRTDHWVVENPDKARSVVNLLADEGVDCIKMRSFASPETYLALIDAANQRGLPLFGHSPGVMDPIVASNAGQRTFEHAFYPWPWNEVPAEKKLDIENTFRKNGSLVVPTLIAWQTYRSTFDVVAAVLDNAEGKSDVRLKYVSPSLRKNWFFGVGDMKSMGTGTPGWNKAIDQVYEQVAEMHDHGVGIMVGTDTGVALVYPGSAVHEELKLLVAKCRFTPMDALLSATIIPAKLFHMEDRLGTIEKGKLADLVLLSANPLEDIANTEKIDGVMLNGKWLDRTALNKIAVNVENKIALNKQTKR